MTRILVVGDVMTDVLAVHGPAPAVGTDTPARIDLTGGGSAANTAAWLADLGMPVTLVSVVGTDAAGSDRLDELRAAGVDCAIRRTRDAPTGTVVVLSRAGERSMLTDRGANSCLSTVDIDTALAEAPEAVHLPLSRDVLLDEQGRGWTSPPNRPRSPTSPGPGTPSPPGSCRPGARGPGRRRRSGRVPGWGPGRWRWSVPAPLMNYSSASMIRGGAADGRAF